MNPQEAYAYDAFISYSHKDEVWVTETLLKNLEEAGLRVCIDYRDFRPGAPSLEEMVRGAKTSRKTLLVLTPDYLKSNWGMFERMVIQTMDPGNVELRVIPLLKAKCELPESIRYMTYVDFTRADRVDLAWTKLYQALSVPSEEMPPSPAQGAAAQTSVPGSADRMELNRQLNERCSTSDVRDLCFALSIDYDNYPSAKGDFIRELLLDLERQGRLGEFVQTVRSEKPWVLR